MTTQSYPKKTTFTCPKSHQPVQEFETYFIFPGYQGVYCYKDCRGHQMTPDDYILIFTDRSPIYDFQKQDKSGTYRAKLKFDPEAKKFVNDFPPANLIAVNCPKSGKPIDAREKYYVFPGFPRLKGAWRVIATRPMAAEDYVQILSNPGEPVEFHNFLSKANRPYSAKLKYNEATNSIDMIFPPRAPQPEGKAESTPINPNEPTKTGQGLDDEF